LLNLRIRASSDISFQRGRKCKWATPAKVRPIYKTLYENFIWLYNQGANLVPAD